MQRFSLYGVHKRDYQESVTIGQTDARTHTQIDAGQSDPYVPLCFADPYVPLCFAGDTKTDTFLYLTFFSLLKWICTFPLIIKLMREPPL